MCVRYAPAQDPPPFFQTSVAFSNRGLMEKKGAGFHTSSSTFWDPESDAGTSYRWENKALICVVQVFGIGMWGAHVGRVRWAWEVVENARLSRFERLHREREREIYIYIYINAYLDGQKKSFLDSTCFNMKFAPRALSCMTTAIWILRCFASLPATGCHAVGVAVISFHPEKLKEFNQANTLCGWCELDAAGPNDFWLEHIGATLV